MTATTELIANTRVFAGFEKPETYKETVDELAAAKARLVKLADALEAAVQQPNREALADKLEVAIADWDHRMHMDQPTRPLADELADVVLAALPIPATGEVEYRAQIGHVHGPVRTDAQNAVDAALEAYADYPFEVDDETPRVYRRTVSDWVQSELTEVPEMIPGTRAALDALTIRPEVTP